MIICTYNRASYLGGAIRSLMDQGYPKEDYEILVVDNYSTDSTREVVLEMQKRSPVLLKYLQEERQGLSHARNRGMHAAGNDVISYLDDDAVAVREWLTELSKVYEQCGADVVGGRVLLEYDRLRPRWLSGDLEGWLSGLDIGGQAREIHYPEFLVGANITFRASWLRKVNGFDPALGLRGKLRASGEECELQWRMGRLGARVFYAPAACVTHRVTPERLTRNWFLRRWYHGGRAEVFLKVKFEGRIAALRNLRGMMKDFLCKLLHGREGGFRCALRAVQILGFMNNLGCLVFPLKDFIRDCSEYRRIASSRKRFYDPRDILGELEHARREKIGSTQFLGYTLRGNLLRLFFETVEPIARRCGIFVHLYPERRETLPHDRAAYGFMNLDHRPAVPTSRWRNGMVFIDEINLAAIPRGRYTLRFGVFDVKSLERIPVAHAANECVEIGGIELSARMFDNTPCAISGAAYSRGPALPLPFRTGKWGSQSSIKRMIRRAFLIEPNEVIKKNVHKLPYRFADRLLPRKVKESVPAGLRNMARAVFRTTDVRLFRQKKWHGPLVSVIIPCHNYGQYLDDALQSVLGQTFSDCEVLIIDDGSTDRFTIDKLNEIERRGIQTVRVMRQANAGVSAARNNGIHRARGRYICCLDADDCLHATYLEKCLLVLESRNLDLCYTHVQIFGDEEGIWKTGEFDARSLIEANRVCTAAVFTKSAWERAGGFNPNMHHGWEDWDFWISVAEAGGRGCVIPEALFFYRRHGATRDVRASRAYNRQLLGQIRENHLALFEGRRKMSPRVRYRVRDPLVNICADDGMGSCPDAQEGVLFMLPWMVVGGADAILLGIMRSILEKDATPAHIMTTLDPFPSMGDSSPDFYRVTPYIYKLPHLMDEQLWMDYIAWYIRRRKIQTIFICGASFIYQHLSALKKMFPSLRIIDQLFNDSARGHVQNNRRYADSIDLTLVVSEKIRKSILGTHGGDPGKILTIYHGTDMNVFNPAAIQETEAREQLKLPGGKRIVLWVGRCSVEKNPALFLDVADSLRGEEECRFVLAGDGPLLEEIKASASRRGLHNMVFPGMVRGEDMPFFYRCASVLVVTSEVEGVPLTIYEALSMGVPVVSTAIGGISDVVREGENGYLCHAQDGVCLAQKVREALNYPWKDIRGSLDMRHDLRNVFSRYSDIIKKVNAQ